MVPTHAACRAGVNYFLLLLLAFAGAFVRNPWALVALAVCTLGGVCLNDTFATSLRHGLQSPLCPCMAAM